MTIDPIPPHTLVSFDIRPVLTNLDMYAVKSFATQRWQRDNNINPDYAMLYKIGSPTDQKLKAYEAQVIDDFIIATFNSFEFTWIQRDQSHVTPKEHEWFFREEEARRMLFRCAQMRNEFAGMFAHYQRLGDTMFLVVPKF